MNFSPEQTDMNQNIKDLVRKLTGRRQVHQQKADILRTRIWLENIFRQHKVGAKEVELMLCDERESTGIVLKWLRGIHAAKPHKVEILEQHYRGSSKIYKLPLFDLLADRDFSQKKLDELVSLYIDRSGVFPVWKFPFRSEQLEVWCDLYDSNKLLQRGDVYGFMGILYLVRLAEANNDSHAHFCNMVYAYRALQGPCRDPVFRKRWRELLDCLKGIHSRLITTTMLVKPLAHVYERKLFEKSPPERELIDRILRFDPWNDDSDPPFCLASFN